VHFSANLHAMGLASSSTPTALLMASGNPSETLRRRGVPAKAWAAMKGVPRRRSLLSQ
jgi:hypothetical protein